MPGRDDLDPSLQYDPSLYNEDTWTNDGRRSPSSCRSDVIGPSCHNRRKQLVLEQSSLSDSTYDRTFAGLQGCQLRVTRGHVGSRDRLGWFYGLSIGLWNSQTVWVLTGHFNKNGNFIHNNEKVSQEQKTKNKRKTSAQRRLISNLAT